MKLLVADDEELVRFTIIDMIHELNLNIDEIDEAHNSSTMIEKCLSDPPDIGFVDIQMPGKSGLEAIKELNSRGIKTKWIVLTGYSEFSFAQQAVKLHTEDYLLKPPTPEEIKRVLLPLIPEEEQGHSILVQQAFTIIKRDYSQDLGLAQVAYELNVTPNYLSGLFHKESGLHFTKFLNNYRLRKAKELFEESQYNVKEVAYQVGYNSSRHFASSFRQDTGLTPSEYIQKHRNPSQISKS